MSPRDVLVVDRDECRARLFRSLGPRYLHCYDEVRSALIGGPASSFWVAVHYECAQWVRRALADLPARRSRRTLWLQCEVSPVQYLPLYSGFCSVLPNPQAVLPAEEMAQALNAERPSDYCIAAHHHAADAELTVWRGDFSQLVVALAPYQAEESRAELDAMQLAVTDSGQTLALGDYEISVDSILYERDSRYRRRANARRVDQDKSFGGCLRRLRSLRRCGRDEFPGISAKTIARIERNEVTSPHAQTLRTIARVLRVAPEEIPEY